MLYLCAKLYVINSFPMHILHVGYLESLVNS